MTILANMDMLLSVTNKQNRAERPGMSNDSVIIYLPQEQVNITYFKYGYINGRAFIGAYQGQDKGIIKTLVYGNYAGMLYVYLKGSMIKPEIMAGPKGKLP